MTEKRWNALARRKCGTCQGDKGLGGIAVDQQGKRTELEPCPDCQQDGGPTGLAMWELTVVCTWIHDTEGCEGPRQKSCHGTGRVLLSGDLLLAAVRRVLQRHGAFMYSYAPEYENPHCYSYETEGFLHERNFHGETEELAALCALEGLVEVGL